MIALLRRDAALRAWPLWLLVIGLNSGAVMGLLALAARRDGSPTPPSAFLLAAWLGVAVYLLAGPVRTRCGSFHLALPLSSRRLWLSHAAAVLLGSTSIALLSIGAMLGQTRLLGGIANPGLNPLALATFLGAGVALAVVLLQAPKPSLARIPFTAGYALWAVAVLVAVGALLVLLHDMGGAWAALPLTLALAAGLATVRSLPATFSLVPVVTEATRPTVAARATATSGKAAPGLDGTLPSAVPSRWVVIKTVLRGVSSGFKEWLGIPFVLLFAITSGGGLNLLGEDLGDLRFIYIPLTTYMLFVLVGPRLSRLHHLDPLPISRVVLFAALIVPYLALFCIGYGLGVLGETVVARRGDLVQYLETRAGYRVDVPFRHLEIAWSGRVPEATAPWGESHVPAGQALWSGSRAVLYSPYAAPPGSSPAFVAHQLGRAAQTVYGVAIPTRDVADRLLETDATGRVVPSSSPLSLRPYTAGRASRGAGPLFPAMMALICVPWLILVAVLLRTYRADVSDAVRQRIVWGLMSSLLIVAIGLVATTIAKLMRPWLIRALVEIPVRRLGDSPVEAGGVWVASLVLVALSYLLAQSQFLRMEIPVRPTRFTLVDWLREDH